MNGQDLYNPLKETDHKVDSGIVKFTSGREKGDIKLAIRRYRNQNFTTLMGVTKYKDGTIVV